MAVHEIFCPPARDMRYCRTAQSRASSFEWFQCFWYFDEQQRSKFLFRWLGTYHKLVHCSAPIFYWMMCILSRASLA